MYSEDQWRKILEHHYKTTIAFQNASRLLFFVDSILSVFLIAWFVLMFTRPHDFGLHIAMLMLLAANIGTKFMPGRALPVDRMRREDEIDAFLIDILKNNKTDSTFLVANLTPYTKRILLRALLLKS